MALKASEIKVGDTYSERLVEDLKTHSDRAVRRSIW